MSIFFDKRQVVETWTFVHALCDEVYSIEAMLLWTYDFDI